MHCIPVAKIYTNIQPTRREVYFDSFRFERNTIVATVFLLIIIKRKTVNTGVFLSIWKTLKPLVYCRDVGGLYYIRLYIDITYIYYIRDGYALDRYSFPVEAHANVQNKPKVSTKTVHANKKNDPTTQGNWLSNYVECNQVYIVFTIRRFIWNFARCEINRKSVITL